MASIPSWQTIGILFAIAVIARLVAYRIWRQFRAFEPGRSRPADTATMRPLMAAGSCALALAVLIAALLTGHLTAVDNSIRNQVQLLHNHGFVQFSLFITALGNFETLMAVTVVAAGLLWAFRQYRDIASLAVSVAGSQITTYFLKYVIGRERPEFEVFASAVTPSFPSAHATGAVAVYGLIILAIAQRLSPRAHFEVAFWGTSFIVLLAATRIFLGVHYFSDVIAGMLVGGFWLITGRSTCR